MNPLFRIDFSISDSLKIVRKSVLIYETIIVQLKKGEPTTVDLTFGGWPNFTYWVYIEADYTKAEITINP